MDTTYTEEKRFTKDEVQRLFRSEIGRAHV